MSQQDVEVVEKFFKTILAGDLAGGLELVHPDLVINEGDGLPYGGNYVGREGVERLLQKIFGPFELDVQYDVSDAGSYVAVRIKCVFTSRKTGESVKMPVVELYELKDGLIWRGDIYYKDTQTIADLHARSI